MLEIYNLGEWLEFEPEILVLGSSFAKANVNHFVLEDMFNTTKIANFGESYATPFEMFVSVYKNKNKLKKVKKVFISLEPFTLSEKYYINLPIEIKLLSDKQLNYFKIYHKNYLLNHPFNFDFKSNTLKNYKKFKIDYIYNGFKPRIYTDFNVDDEKKIKNIFFPLKLFDVSLLQIKSLKKIKDFFRDSEIIFFLSPFYFMYSLYEKYLLEFDKKLIFLLKKHLGNIKLSGILENKYFKKSDFYDDHHLNLFGATKFTYSMINYNIFLNEITSLLDVKMPYLALPKCYCCEYIEKLINELRIFLRGKNRIALLGNGNIAKIIKLLVSKEFIIFYDANYDNKYVFSTSLINKFTIDGIIQTHFGKKLNINKPYFKISENFRILHTCLKMYFSVYKNFDIRKFV